MSKDKAIAMRDRLEVMASNALVDNPDQEDHIIACCLAVATEELEKWIYGDEWTPSVRPYIDNRKFEIPYDPETADDAEFSGPPWKREKKKALSFEQKFPTVARLKQQGRLNRQAKRTLNSIKMEDWSRPITEMFRSGDRSAFSRALRVETGASVKQLMDYVNRMIAKYPMVWGIDDKPGDVCPKCGETDIDQPRTPNSKEFVCKGCGLQWGSKIPWGRKIEHRKPPSVYNAGGGFLYAEIN